MKRLVMLTCMDASKVCSGAACFRAFNERTESFAAYGKEEAQVIAFLKCGGCGSLPETDRALAGKIERILSLSPDAVHVGICCFKEGKKERMCPEAAAILRVFEEHGVPAVLGTHSVL